MEQVEAQLKKVRAKLDEIPALQKAEVRLIFGGTRQGVGNLLAGWVVCDGRRGRPNFFQVRVEFVPVPT